MIEEKQRSIMKLAAMVVLITAATFAFVRVYNSKKTTQAYPAETVNETTTQNNMPAAKTDGPNNVQVQPVLPQTERKIQLQDIVRLRQTWGAILTAWYGEDAPDFTLTDIEGKEHKLSDYRGRNVILVFWATWCRPCVLEIPSLIALRNMISDDKLAVLAISSEPSNRLKRIVADRKINYTVFSGDSRVMARPYNQVMGIPTSFFIDPRGRIKIISEGTMPFNDIRAILEAE